MTLRQVWVRVWSLLIDPESLLRRYVDAEAAKEAATNRVNEVEEVLAQFKRPSEGG